jgi:hypothetical protein
MCRHFSQILFHLFQKILEYEKIPEKLKIVSITPVHNKGKTLGRIDSYRPITIEKKFTKIV